MPCPHCKITIIKRSENESAVSAAAYQSGEKLFSEYDQEQKYYPYKNEVTHKEILLPPHASPEFADRNTLWNSAEAQEKQWNSQLARRFVLAIPREIPSEQHADLIRDCCREFFVSKGMIADFAIHDNMHDFDTFNIFKWIFKTFVATYLLTNCFTIVMAVFDVAQNVVSQSAGVINGNMDVTAALADLETQLEANRKGSAWVRD